MRGPIILAALLLLGAAPPEAMPSAPAEVVATLPHDRSAFTEGLFFRDGAFYESTGEVGRSFIRKVDPATGRVLRQVVVPPPYFGEGIVAWGKQLISLTWKDGLGFRWTLDGFRRSGTFRYPGEGWALTSDGRNLIMSDGTPQLRFLDPVTLKERRRVTVTANGEPVGNVNELEFVDGEVLANVWHTNAIIRIDPVSGHVVGLIDLSALTAQVHATDPEAVPNGIAWDAKRRRLWVTGKDWPTIFQIRPPKG